jgi:PhzF family phenazine biosynthesis protein
VKLQIHHIDAFTDMVFKGNYAAVIILDEWLSDALMQLIATENNLSETAFALKNTSNSFHIRWFSPICEIDFCGHATLATAYVLFKQYSDLNQVTFSTNVVGDLRVRRAEHDYIEMTFPNCKPKKVSSTPKNLISGLSIAPTEVLLSQQAYFVIYENEQDVHSVKPDLEALKKLAPYDVVVTATSAKYDFISRYFWPANGGDEDPVTGSIHTGLAPFWAERLNKNTLTAYQASKRGGILQCTVSDNNVVILGQAVQYLEGYIDV